MKLAMDLDATGLLCPMPVIKVQNHINTMATGELLRVTFTDPGAVHDIPAWCRVHGHEVVEICENDRKGSMIIQVGE